MTIKEQIAKAIILKFNNENGRYDEFFENYDKQCNNKGFISDVIEENNFETILWEFGNLNEINSPQEALRVNSDINNRKELDNIINQFIQ